MDADGTEFIHAAEAFDGTSYYKHPLEIKQSAEKLISYVTANYDKVIVLLTGSSPIEAGILRDYDKIDSILWTGTLGDGGFSGGTYAGWGEVARLLNGDVNPSGRTVDLWVYDFTARRYVIIQQDRYQVDRRQLHARNRSAQRGMGL